MKKESLDYCEKDYKHRHYWELVGNVGFDYLIYRCSQCRKCKLVWLKYLQGEHIEEYDTIIDES
jgi:hypothetical protein